MDRIKKLFKVRYPLIQGGMIWCSPWQLAAAVSNAGGLGVIGAGSMYPEVLISHVKKCKTSTTNPFAVNLPLLYPDIEKHVHTIIDNQVPIVITSAGSPKKYTSLLQAEGIKVVHVVSSALFAKKSEDAGVDAVVAEGFEAGGHNGREETTTLTLIPQVVDAVDIPVIAAGGIGSGRAMLAAMVMGAEGVQVGSRFVASEESSAHINFKQRVVSAGEGETKLTLKELTPVRLLDNPFHQQVNQKYAENASVEELKQLLGRGRAKKGMFEGDLTEGELEIGQVSGTINEIMPAADIVKEFIADFEKAQKLVTSLHLG